MRYTHERAATAALASRLSTTAIACYGEDKSVSASLREFVGDRPTAVIERETGGVLRYEGEGDGPTGRGGLQRFDRYFSELALFIPAVEIASDGFDRQIVLRNVASRQIARVDYLVLDA